MEPTLHEKPYFLFPNVPKRWSFHKNFTEIWSFLYHQERWYFFSLKIWYYSLGGKWKMVFLKKNTWKYDIFFNVLKKWSFQRNCTGIWTFLYHEERWHFFFLKIWYSFTDGKWKMIFLKKYMETWNKKYMETMLVKVVFLFPTNMKLPFCQKSKDDLFPKNTRKDDISGITEKYGIHPRKDDISILGWHSRKSSNDSLYFYGDLFKCFHILLSNKKTQET